MPENPPIASGLEHTKELSTRVAVTGRTVDGRIVTEVLTLDGTNPVTTENKFVAAGQPKVVDYDPATENFTIVIDKESMMPAIRCPNCEKFASLETAEEPEIQGEEIQGDEDDGYFITGEVRIVRVCQDCGEELKEANLEFEMECPPGFSEDGWEYELDSTVTERADTVNSKGRPIKPRYAKSYYGAEITATFTSPEVACVACNGSGHYDTVGSPTCSECRGNGKTSESTEVSVIVDEQASFFEELV